MTDSGTISKGGDGGSNMNHESISEDGRTTSRGQSHPVLSNTPAALRVCIVKNLGLYE